MRNRHFIPWKYVLWTTWREHDSINCSHLHLRHKSQVSHFLYVNMAVTCEHCNTVYVHNLLESGYRLSFIQLMKCKKYSAANWQPTSQNINMNYDSAENDETTKTVICIQNLSVSNRTHLTSCGNYFDLNFYEYWLHAHKMRVPGLLSSFPDSMAASLSQTELSHAHHTDSPSLEHLT